MNSTDSTTYGFDSNHKFPQPVNFNPSLLGVEAMIVNASINQNSATTIDIVSTLNSNVSILRGSMIQCRSGLMSSVVLNVTEIGGNYYFIAP